jgi:hypothetical protein
MTGSTLFLKDLVQLSDVSSDAVSELCLPQTSATTLSYTAMESVIGLLESKLRRRNIMVMQCGIMTLLGLSRNTDPLSADNLR